MRLFLKKQELSWQSPRRSLSIIYHRLAKWQHGIAKDMFRSIPAACPRCALPFGNILGTRLNSVAFSVRCRMAGIFSIKKVCAVLPCCRGYRAGVRCQREAFGGHLVGIVDRGVGACAVAAADFAAEEGKLFVDGRVQKRALERVGDCHWQRHQ